MWREPSKDDEALPRLLVVGISLIGIGLLIANTALVAWFIIRKRIKGKKNATRFLFSFYSIIFVSNFAFFCWLFAVSCCHSSTIFHLFFYLIFICWRVVHAHARCCYVRNLMIIPMDIQHTGQQRCYRPGIYISYTIFIIRMGSNSRENFIFNRPPDFSLIFRQMDISLKFGCSSIQLVRCLSITCHTECN